MDDTKLTDKDTPDWSDFTARQRKALVALSSGLSVTAAAEAATINRWTIYRWRQESEAFGEAMARAMEEGIDRLEDHARARAMDLDRPSDALTMFLLKAHRPVKFRERVDLAHSGGIENVKRVILSGHDPELIENLEGKLALESEDNDRLRGQLAEKGLDAED